MCLGVERLYRKPIWAAFRLCGASVQKYAIFISAHAPPLPRTKRENRNKDSRDDTREPRYKPEIRVNWNSHPGRGNTNGLLPRARFGIALVNCTSTSSNYTLQLSKNRPIEDPSRIFFNDFRLFLEFVDICSLRIEIWRNEIPQLRPLLCTYLNSFLRTWDLLCTNTFEFFLSLTCPRNKLWEREVKSLSAI